MTLYERASSLLRWAFDGLKSPAVLDAEALFPEHKQLLNLYPSLQSEALRLLPSMSSVPLFHEITDTQKPYSDNDGRAWRILVVKAYGHKIQQNAILLPTLDAFLRSNPRVTSAALSILEPGKHIPPHWGPFRGIARFHLCLYAQTTDAVHPILTLDGVKYAQRERDWLLWDDTFTHEVINPTEFPRMALLLDIRRNDLPSHLQVLASFVLTVGFLLVLTNTGRFSSLKRPSIV